MKRIFFYLFALLCFIPSSLMAQDADVDGGKSDDLETNHTLGIEKKLTKQLNIALDAEYRTRDYYREFDRVSISPSVEYKFIKNLKLTLGGAYVYVNNDAKEKLRSDGSLKWQRQSYWAPRYRGYAAVTGDIDLGRFNIALRERYQLTYRSKYTAIRNYYTRDGEFNYSEDDIRESQTNQVLRSRLLISYDIRHCAFSPFASVEITNDLVDDFSVAKLRYALGVDWKVNKHNIFEFGYMYQDVRCDDGEDDVNSHILSVGYKYKF